jgi:hypothetical protein
MHSDHTQLIAILEHTPQTLASITAALPEVALDFRPSPSEWSTREILAHLVDDEMFVMRTRLERMMKEKNPSLLAHDEKAWYRQRNTSRDALSELLSDFRVQRAASLGIVKFLRENEWARSAFHPEYGRFTAEQWIGYWGEHDLTHLRQIEHTLALYGHGRY